MADELSLPLPQFLSRETGLPARSVIEFMLASIVIFFNRQFFLSGIKAAFRLAPDMATLVSLGSGAGFVYSLCAIIFSLITGRTDVLSMLYFDSSAMILVVISIGKHLEARSKRRTADAVRKLLELAPDTATVVRDGKEVQVRTDEISVGESVVVKSGNAVPLDGVITSGSAFMDESAMTGESLPVEKKTGDEVLGGTFCTDGYFAFKVTKTCGDTALAKIAEVVEAAGSSAAPAARIADKVSSFFVPAVVSISLITFAAWLISGFGFHFALSCAMAVLVVSCPCALGLASPVAVMTGTGRAASFGILFRNAEVLENLRKGAFVVMDKTGTITEGRPKVESFKAICGKDVKNVLYTALLLETASTHPLSSAIKDYCMSNGVKVKENEFVTEFRNSPGQGITGEIASERYFMGGKNLLDALGLKTPDFSEPAGTATIYVTTSDEILGYFIVSDKVRDDSRAAVAEFQALGLETIMLTGDSLSAAEKAAKETNVKKIYASVLPIDKGRIIRELREKSGKDVIMIGDGINDAPALAEADYAIAIGAGSDVAIDASDVVLIKNSLLDAVTAFKLSKAVMKNIRENLFWAFFYNVTAIPIAAGVLYVPFGLSMNAVIAACAMSASSIFVVLNALRLRNFRVNK